MILNNCESNKPKTSVRAEDYVGNNKKYSISEITHHLRIIGNGNRIYLTTNSGTLEIIGNSTVVRIMDNQGSLVYTGNNGRIYLCNDSQVKSVKYTGSNGSIKLVTRDELLAKKSAKVATVISPIPLQRNHSSNDDCNNLFDRKFKKLNNYLDVNNESTPNLRTLQIDLCNNVIKIAQSNIVINRN